MKKLSLVLFMLLAAIACVFAGGAQETQPAAQQPAAENDGPIEVLYWHTWGSDNLKYLEGVAEAFNASQSKYHVTLQYVGDKNALYSKLQVVDQKDMPAMINSTTECLGSYIYTDYVVPLTQIVPEADKSVIDNLYPNVKSAWSNGAGELYGYPMGNSMSGILFNMDIMDEMGINPYEDVKSVEDLYAVIKKAYESGKLPGSKVIGFEHTIRFLDYSLPIEGYYQTDKNNGKDGIPTKSYYNTGKVKELVSKYFETFKAIQDEGYCYTMGSSWGNELLPAFAQQDIVMLTGTIGGYGRVERAWNEIHTEALNACFLPWVSVTSEGKSSGQPASGNGFYIVNNGNEEAQLGAWEFIKFFGTGDNMAGWCALTGYLPISDEVLNTTTYQDYKNARPNLGLDYLMQVQREDDGTAYHPISACYSETSSTGMAMLNKYLAGEGTIDQILAEYEAQIDDILSIWALTNM